MNRFEYIVESIDGDYAHLRRTDIESDELKLVARALLPPEIMEGTKLLYEWMQYSITSIVIQDSIPAILDKCKS